jgi:hypothetical protein
MRFESISKEKLQRIAEDIDEDVTIGAPYYDISLDDKQLDNLMQSVVRKADTVGESENLVYLTETEWDSDEEVCSVFQIDLKQLWTLLYEHRRYSAARGFTDAEMQVLRAIEFHTADRVGIDEIEDSEHTQEIAESTIYKSLRSLREKKLVDRVRPGLYRYSGP